MMRLEVRNLPADRLARYLVEEFAGTDNGEGVVTGDGWRVRFVPGEPVHMRAGTIPVLFIEIDGEREADAAAFMRQKTMRGGG